MVIKAKDDRKVFICYSKMKKNFYNFFTDRNINDIAIETSTI